MAEPRLFRNLYNFRFHMIQWYQNDFIPSLNFYELGFCIGSIEIHLKSSPSVNQFPRDTSTTKLHLLHFYFPNLINQFTQIMSDCIVAKINVLSYSIPFSRECCFPNFHESPSGTNSVTIGKMYFSKKDHYKYIRIKTRKQPSKLHTRISLHSG